MPYDLRQTLPLTGVNVIDFGQYIAGPAVAMMLGDLGATVIHVDPPGGPVWKNPANAILNRNKKLVTLDLKSQSDLATAKQLIGDADIVIENFRPGKLAALGLDLATLRETFAHLITVSIPGFASNDDLRKDWRAYESIIAAASGIFTDMGLNRVLMGVNPSFSPLPLSSAYGAMIAASATVFALQSRQHTGVGDAIEVPLATAAMEGLCYNSIHVANYPPRYKTQREQEIERRRATGEAMDVSFDHLQDLLDPFYRSYRCKDGRMFYVVCPSHKNHAKRCLKALGIYDDLIAEGLSEEEDTYLPTDQWKSDVSLGVYPLPKKWADIISARMKEAFLHHTAAEWEKIFGDGGFPGAPHRWLREWLHDDHAQISGLMIDVVDPEFGKMRQPGPMTWLSDSGEAMLSPMPREEISIADARALLSTNQRDIPGPTTHDQKGWLDGVRILDLCNVIAGPHSVSYLARYGADIIKIDPSKPFYDCWNTVVFGMSHMRGKKSGLVDIKTPDGRRVFDDLVKTADVIVWNTTEDQASRYNIDPGQLNTLNPGAIFCRMDCFSGPRKGPRSEYLGYDDLVQASTGIMLRFGGGMDTPEEHAHVGTIDVMCGFGAALGIGAALYQKNRFGKIAHPVTSLSALSGLAQIPFCYDYDGRSDFHEPSGPNVTGYDAFKRFYKTADGTYIFLHMDKDDLPRLQRVDGFKTFDPRHEDNDAACLQSIFATKKADTWITRLNEAGIAIAPCENIETLRAQYARPYDATPGTDGGSYAFSIYQDHPSGRAVTQLDPCGVRTTTGKIHALPPAEKYGASTRKILSNINYSQSKIDDLIRHGSISESWSSHYLPE